MKNLKLNAIYNTISGEAGIFPQGSYCTIIRLQGCNLRCSYCDTPQGQEAHEYHPELNAQLDLLLQRGQIAKRVMITGGEPLFQEESLLNLVKLLWERNHEVQIETNGSYPLPKWPFLQVGWVVDYKMPSSGMLTCMPPFPQFVAGLHQRDNLKVVLKFVVADTDDILDLIYILREINKIRPGYRGNFIISPVDADKELLPKAIKMIQKADEEASHVKILERCVFSLQLHKIVNMP